MIRNRRFSLVAVVWTAVLSANPVRAEPAAHSAFRKLQVFARALAHVEQSHVREVRDDELIEGAMRGMLSALDPHSEYLTPDEYRVLAADTEGRYAGVGVEIDARDGWLTVLAVFPNGPAAAAGVRAGDRFLAIDGLPARDLPIGEAVRRMRGEPGTRVRVSLRRPDRDEAIEVGIVRAVIDVPAVEGRVLRDRVAYLRVRAFQETAPAEFARALDSAVEHAAATGGLRAVVIDLRDNPGGLVGAAVAIADEFLSEGAIVSIRGRGGKSQREHDAHASGTRPDWPLVLVVNAYSASAAEILAGALRDHRRAVLVGTRTFGKGSVQNVIELPDGSAMKLTTALYYTPSGRSIQAHGIEPDVVVEAAGESVEATADGSADVIREADLEHHIVTGRGAAKPDARGREARVRVPDRIDGAAADPFPGDAQARVAYQIARALAATRSPPR
jgi:carboxyl-terminal processing protease